MKKIVICLFALMISTMAFVTMAQDVVYLKNGSVIKGSVIEMIPNQSIKVQTADGSLFVYQMNEVDRIERDAQKQNNQVEEVTDDYLERGFRGLVDLGAHFGFGDAADNYQVSAAFTGGYQINRMLFVGGGIAPTLNIFDYEGYRDDEVITTFLLPIYTAVRLDFINTKVTPFFDGRVGYYLNTDDIDYSDLYFYAGVGVRLKKISLGAGYDYYANDGSALGFATLRFGLEF